MLSMMINVKATAVKTMGIGCIAGDTHEYVAQRIEDEGKYFDVVIHENRQVRFSKEAWEIKINPV